MKLKVAVIRKVMHPMQSPTFADSKMKCSTIVIQREGLRNLTCKHIKIPIKLCTATFDLEQHDSWCVPSSSEYSLIMSVIK